MEVNQQTSAVKQPIYKKWWFWLIVGVPTLSVLGFVLIRTGAVDDGVKISLENTIYEPAVYIQNTEIKVCYRILDFKKSYEKTRVSEDNYAYYTVTLDFKLDCQLKLDGKKYNDDTMTFNPCVVFYSKDNPNFKKVVKTMTVHSGRQYPQTFVIKDVCGGKDKEFASYNYLVKLSVPDNE